MKTIFISIAAQDDKELKNTVKHAFNNAVFPKRVVIGIALTSMTRWSKKEAKMLEKEYNVRLSFVKQKKNDLSTLGIGKGRHRAASLYHDEDYMIQVDCHTYFDNEWDVKLINLFEEAKKELQDDKIVLTAIPLVYKYCCHKHPEPIKTKPETRYPYYLTQSFFVNSVPRWVEGELNESLKEKFLPVAKVSPAFIMGDSSFAKNTGIHKDAIFYDEDLTQSINLFDEGFAFVFPNVKDLPVRHLDSNGIVKGHERYFFLHYLNFEKNKEIHKKLQEEYLKFAKDPKNKNKIEKYKKYAKVDAIKGCFTKNVNAVPETFRLKEK